MAAKLAPRPARPRCSSRAAASRAGRARAARSTTRRPTRRSSRPLARGPRRPRPRSSTSTRTSTTRSSAGAWPTAARLISGAARMSAVRRWPVPTALDAAPRARSRRGRPIIGAGAGTGLSAKCAEAGGIDLIIIYNSGRYRMAGRGSLAGLLPYGDANQIVVEMAARGAARRRRHAGAGRGLRHRPVPAHARVPRRARRPWASPASRTSPPSACIDGVFRQNLEETGMGYDLEVEMIRLAARARPAHRARTSSTPTRPEPWPRPAPTSWSRTSG